jgi:hypothetical protein
VIEIGSITLSDILTVLGILFGGGCLWLFRKVRTSRNLLKGNRAGGNIAGGNICSSNHFKTHTEQRNTLKNNIAAGDIIGGDIEK